MSKLLKAEQRRQMVSPDIVMLAVLGAPAAQPGSEADAGPYSCLRSASALSRYCTCLGRHVPDPRCLCQGHHVPLKCHCHPD